jgi:hypothetical protein
VDLRRVRTWEWFTGAAGLVLLISLFLPWYGIGVDVPSASAAFRSSGSANAFESFAVIDMILVLAALIAIALPIVTAMQRTIAVPQTLSAFVVWIGLIASILALFRLLSPPGVNSIGDAINLEGAFLTRSLGGAGASLDDILSVTREIGAWLGTAAVLAALAGGWKSMRDKRFPAALRPRLRVETIGTPSAEGERRDAVQ